MLGCASVGRVGEQFVAAARIASVVAVAGFNVIATLAAASRSALCGPSEPRGRQSIGSP